MYGPPGMPQVPLASYVSSHMTPHMMGHVSPSGSASISPASSSWQLQSAPSLAFSDHTSSSFNEPTTPLSLAPPQSIGQEPSPQTSKEMRRSISLGDAGKLSKASGLYGMPAWWGEDNPPDVWSDSEMRAARHAPQILRDLSPPHSLSRSISRNSNTSDKSQHSAAGGSSLNKKPVTSSQPEMASSPGTSWTIDIAPKRVVPPKLRNARSADSSPIRRR